MPALNTKAPCRLADIPGDWIEARRLVVKRDGYAIRAGAGNTIEAQSINTGRFCAIVLPSGGVEFANSDARDVVLAQLLQP